MPDRGLGLPDRLALWTHGGVSAKQWHGKALAILAKAHKEKPEENPEVKPLNKINSTELFQERELCTSFGTIRQGGGRQERGVVTARASLGECTAAGL